MFDIIFCVFGCVSKEYYSKQVQDINNTWGKLAKTINNVKLLYFFGENVNNNFISENYVYLDNIGDDMMSASFKQWFGLKHIYENFKTKFIFVCGTDTFVNIYKLLNIIKDLDYKEKLYIGGHGDTRKIENQDIYFHSGGAGFLISHASLRALYPLLPIIHDSWLDICKKINRLDLQIACDVSIAYYLKKLDCKTIIIDKCKFRSCNYLGFPCHINFGRENIKDIIVCHYMSSSDFDHFNNILINNHYFL
jgi:hypothetical protein